MRNSPLVLVDPDGQDYQVCGGYAGCGTVSNSEFGQLSLQLEGNGYIVQNGKFMTRDQVTFGTYQYFYGAGDRIRDFALLMAERAKVSNGIVATVSIGSGATAALRSGLGLLAFRSLASLFGQGAVLTQWPTLGSKLDFLFGLAREVGPKAAENVARSREMLRHMQKIGLPDTAASRAYVSEHLAQILNTSSNIVSRSGTRVVRESLLMGPRGGVKLETVWEDSRLITIMVKGSK